jgi:hypothetical protein
MLVCVSGYQITHPNFLDNGVNTLLIRTDDSAAKAACPKNRREKKKPEAGRPTSGF